MNYKSKISWFVHPDTQPPCPLGFIACRKKGALVIGGKTGSHMTGHTETATQKMQDIIRWGYIDAESAKARSIIPTTWRAPKLNEEDAHLVSLIDEGVI